MIRLKYYITLLILLQHFVPTFVSLEKTVQETKTRVKRDIYHLGRMMMKCTGKSPLAYNNYGHYCGYGGGGKPVDKIDNCCRIHDSCYGYVEAYKHCSSTTIRSFITEIYQFHIEEDEIVCSIKKNRDCSQKICICDKLLCDCLKVFLGDYNKTNKG